MIRKMRRRGTGLMVAACALAAGIATPANALRIDFNNVDNLDTRSSAYMSFRAAANYWESVISSDATVYFNIGFSSAGFSSPNVIGSTGSTRFLGLGMNDVYTAMARTGNSALDGIAAQNMSPLSQVARWNDPNRLEGAVSAITQQAKANGQGVVQNTRAANPNFTGTAANAIGLNGIETASFREFDADGSRNNQELWLNSTVMKALGGFGLTDANYSAANRDANGRGIDAKITFNSAFSFDFDPSDGVNEGQIDFVGTAIHEFGHALGFVSGVDIYDTNTNIAANLDTLQGLMSTLDLFRYSDDVNNLAPGNGQALDWSVGNSATATDNLRGRPYFSFDGRSKGLSAYGGDAGYFSTGATNGDGRQASHWMDTPYERVPGSNPNLQCSRPVEPSRGIMDPTFASCEGGIVTSLDLAAFDAMGWNMRVDVLNNIGYRASSADAFRAFAAANGVPEPGTWAMMVLGFAVAGGAMRRRRTAVRFA